jgi:site-specific DNA-methyltransferase (adenine-specific)
MGSGTTGEACLNLGRSFIGVEKDSGWFARAERRIGGQSDAFALFSG